MDNRSYYTGLSGNLQLLAKSFQGHRPPPEGKDPGARVGSNYQTKRIFVAGTHKLKSCLDLGLRKEILVVLATVSPLRWIACNYIRIGFSLEEATSPLVVFVTVEKGGIEGDEAQRIVREIVSLLLKYDLPDVEVEIAEAQRTLSASVNDKFPRSSANDLYAAIAQNVPLAGASIGRNDPELEGTLGGYISVDGETFALTNHHVLMGTDRLEPYPTLLEENTAPILATQPPVRAFSSEIEALKYDISRPNSHQLQVHENKRKLEKLEVWRGGKYILGRLFKTSGIRSRKVNFTTRHRMDWALIHPENIDRFTKDSLFQNSLPQVHHLLDLTGLQEAFARGGRTLDGFDGFPISLKKHLTTQKFDDMKEELAAQGKKEMVVWKFGRTTKYTWGLVNNISSNYREKDSNLTTDEWVIIDNAKKLQSSTDFSRKGDSGSLIFDCDGSVLGMLWGRPDGSDLNFFTPMDTLLRDIKEACHAKEVKLICEAEESPKSTPSTKEKNGYLSQY